MLTKDENYLRGLPRGLRSLPFNPMIRPKHTDPRSDKEIRWLLRIIAAAQSKFYAEILESYFVLLDAQLHGATPLAARLLFELSASLQHVVSKYPVEQARGNQEAWDFLFKSFAGSYSMKRSPGYESAPVPFRVSKHMIKSLDALLGPGAKMDQHYDSLSDHTHPNFLAFNRYARSERETMLITFVDRAKEHPLSNLIAGSAGTFLYSLKHLLEQADYRAPLKAIDALGVPPAMKDPRGDAK